MTTGFHLAPLGLCVVLLIVIGIPLAFYFSRRLGVIALILLLLSIGGNLIVISWARSHDPISFNPPVFKFQWMPFEWENCKLEEQYDGDDARFTMHCSGEHVLMTPGFSIDIQDKSSFPIPKTSHLNFYLLLEWENKKIALEHGTTKPVISYALDGYLEWKPEMIQEAPNMFILRLHMHYSPDESKQIVASKTVSITVKVVQG